MNVLAFSCTHAPFHHAGSLDFLVDLKRRYKPDTAVCLGDLGDQHGWSRWERNPDTPGQGDEDTGCVGYCRRLYRIFPRAKACIGNHDTRLAKTASRAGIPSRFVASIRKIYQSPRGWVWADYWTLDDVFYYHGVGYSGADAAVKCAKSIGRSCVIGHIHSTAGVRYTQSFAGRMFGCSAGCLADPESLAMAYGKEHAAKPILGACVVLDGVPHFIPMES